MRNRILMAVGAALITLSAAAPAATTTTAVQGSICYRNCAMQCQAQYPNDFESYQQCYTSCIQMHCMGPDPW